MPYATSSHSQIRTFPQHHCILIQSGTAVKVCVWKRERELVYRISSMSFVFASRDRFGQTNLNHSHSHGLIRKYTVWPLNFELPLSSICWDGERDSSVQNSGQRTPTALAHLCMQMTSITPGSERGHAAPTPGVLLHTEGDADSFHDILIQDRKIRPTCQNFQLVVLSQQFGVTFLWSNHSSKASSTHPGNYQL